MLHHSGFLSAFVERMDGCRAAQGHTAGILLVPCQYRSALAKGCFRAQKASKVPLSKHALRSPNRLRTFAAASAVAVAAASPSVANFSAVVSSISLFIVAAAVAIFLLAAVPTLFALAKTAIRIESILQQIEKEIPETVATLRLSGLELTDCISAIGAVGLDLSNGLRSTARLATTVESGVKQGVNLTQHVVPALAKQENAARDALEAGLQARAQLQYTLPIMRNVKNAAAATLVGLNVVHAVNGAKNLLRGNAPPSKPPPSKPPSSKAASSKAAPIQALTNLAVPSNGVPRNQGSS